MEAALLILVITQAGLSGWLFSQVRRGKAPDPPAWMPPPPKPPEFGPKEMAELIRSATMNATRDAHELATATIEKVGAAISTAVKEILHVPQGNGLPTFSIAPNGEIIPVDGTTELPWHLLPQFDNAGNQHPDWTDDLEPDPSGDDPTSRATLIAPGFDLLSSIKAMPKTPAGHGFQSVPDFNGEMFDPEGT